MYTQYGKNVFGKHLIFKKHTPHTKSNGAKKPDPLIFFQNGGRNESTNGQIPNTKIKTHQQIILITVFPLSISC